MLAVPCDADQRWTESVLHDRLSKNYKVAHGGLALDRQEVLAIARYAIAKIWPCLEGR